MKRFTMDDPNNQFTYEMSRRNWPPCSRTAGQGCPRNECLGKPARGVIAWNDRTMNQGSAAGVTDTVMQIACLLPRYGLQ